MFTNNDGAEDGCCYELLTNIDALWLSVSDTLRSIQQPQSLSIHESSRDAWAEEGYCPVLCPMMDRRSRMLDKRSSQMLWMFTSFSNWLVLIKLKLKYLYVWGRVWTAPPLPCSNPVFQSWHKSLFNIPSLHPTSLPWPKTIPQQINTKSIKLKRPARGGGRPSWDSAKKFALLGPTFPGYFDWKSFYFQRVSLKTSIGWSVFLASFSIFICSLVKHEQVSSLNSLDTPNICVKYFYFDIS